MPFIGKQPEVGAYSKLDAITTSATATYNLTLGGGAYYPSSANHLLVSLNGVMQAPQDSFTVSGSTIVFASTLASTDSIDFIMALGDVLDIGTPSDGTVTSAKLGGALTTPSNLTVGGVLDATTATFDRASTDGVIVNLQKNNGSIGSIDVDNGDNLTVQGKSDHSGLQFGTNAIFPHKNSANIDATIDLGEGSLRWKDIYLSGGVYLGGTGAANKLDDYEHGSWTPVFSGATSAGTYTYVEQQGHYVRVGNQVTAWVNLTNITTGSAGSGTISITGLPYAANWMSGFNGESVGVIGLHGFAGINGLFILPIINDGNSNILLYHFEGSTNAGAAINVTDKTNNGSDIRGYVTYYIGG